MNEDDQAELKQKFDTSVPSKRKRKGAELKNESTKAKQMKTDDETSENLNEQEKTRLKKVFIVFYAPLNKIFLMSVLGTK